MNAPLALTSARACAASDSQIAEFLAQNPSFAPSAGKTFGHALTVAGLKCNEVHSTLSRAKSFDLRGEMKLSAREARIAIRFIRDLAKIADEIEGAIVEMEGGQ